MFFVKLQSDLPFLLLVAPAKLLFYLMFQNTIKVGTICKYKAHALVLKISLITLILNEISSPNSVIYTSTILIYNESTPN